MVATRKKNYGSAASPSKRKGTVKSVKKNTVAGKAGVTKKKLPTKKATPVKTLHLTPSPDKAKTPPPPKATESPKKSHGKAASPGKPLPQTTPVSPGKPLPQKIPATAGGRAASHPPPAKAPRSQSPGKPISDPTPQKATGKNAGEGGKGEKVSHPPLKPPAKAGHHFHVVEHYDTDFFQFAQAEPESVLIHACNCIGSW
jgi:hypothetical protein